MYPKITSTKDWHRSIYYNENKVEKNTALFIYAANYIKDTHQLTLKDKLERFDRLNALNQRPEKKTFHISLNFDPSEKISAEKMVQIAVGYMDGIGFGRQPYLVYQHLDVAHPHLHVVASNIRSGLRRLPIYKYQSELVRRDIEERFGLVKGGGFSKKQQNDIKPLSAQRLHYGQSQTKESIADVLSYVLDNYKFTSLTELNAMLRTYNVKADPGKPGGRMWSHRGMAYRALDGNGKGIGARIKASSFSFKPTLANLELKFLENKIKREPDLHPLQSAINYAIRKNTRNWDQFVKALKNEKILAVPHHVGNRLEEITFIDLNSKTIAAGTALGKDFRPASVLERLGLDPVHKIADQQMQMDEQLQLSQNQEQRKDRGRSL